MRDFASGCEKGWINSPPKMDKFAFGCREGLGIQTKPNKFSASQGLPVTKLKIHQFLLGAADLVGGCRTHNELKSIPIPTNPAKSAANQSKSIQIRPNPSKSCKDPAKSSSILRILADAARGGGRIGLWNRPSEVTTAPVGNLSTCLNAQALVHTVAPEVSPENRETSI